LGRPEEEKKERGEEMKKAPQTEVDERGYRRFVNSGHYVHRWVMEKELKRKLLRNEIVHHKNGNKLDNRPENLEVMTRKEHYKIHVVPKMDERRASGIREKLIPELEAQVSKAFLIGFAAAGTVLFIVGLITKSKLDMWYIGLIFLVAAVVAWYFVLKRNES
jgi:hypothetical protein